MMYSDKWRKQGCYKKLRVHKDDMFLYDWYSQEGAHVGVSVDYEIAEDVHYEIKRDDWIRLLGEVIHEEDVYRPSKKTIDFLAQPEMHYEFGLIMNLNHIAYKKIAFN